MSFDVSVYQIPIAVRIFIKYSVNQLIFISILFDHINQFPSSHVFWCHFWPICLVPNWGGEAKKIRKWLPTNFLAILANLEQLWFCCFVTKCLFGRRTKNPKKFLTNLLAILANLEQFTNFTNFLAISANLK